MENKFIYLDNAATTKPSAAAVNAMLKSAEIFGNPSSLHGAGLEAEKLVEGSRMNIAQMLGVQPKSIYFTSGGTEANNTAVFGAAYAKRKQGRDIITTQIEHPSVLECFKRLEEEGFNVTYLGVDSGGRISLDELRSAVTPKTTLVSIMHVNNETGVIQPVDGVREILKEKAPRAVFHCDCVQSFGKIPVDPKKWRADMLTISAHKINGFKGCGALYMENQTIRPLICGGEQQHEIRPGTENVGGIAAFGAAAAECRADAENMKAFRTEFIKKLKNAIDDTVINGSDEYNSGNVINVSFLGIKAEILLHALERHGIYVSTGSACSSHKPQPSHVLKAMGCDAKTIGGAVRISFSEPMSEEDTEYTVEAFKKEAELIRRYM